MAGEYDEKFDKLTGLVERVAGRVDEMRLEVRDLVEQGNEHGRKLDTLDVKVDHVSGQLNDVIGKVISHEKRLRLIEEETPFSPGVS